MPSRLLELCDNAGLERGLRSRSKHEEVGRIRGIITYDLKRSAKFAKLSLRSLRSRGEIGSPI